MSKTEVVELEISRVKPNVVCSVCGKQFRVAPSRVKKTKVCSRRCYAEWRRMKYRNFGEEGAC